MRSGFPSPVILDIGGKKFSTTVETLIQREPDSMLAAMFSGRHMISQDSGKASPKPENNPYITVKFMRAN